jgi:hypothetical protein
MIDTQQQQPTKPRKQFLQIRLGPTEREAISRLVARHGENASVVVRSLIRKAAAEAIIEDNRHGFESVGSILPRALSSIPSRGHGQPEKE